MVKTLKATAADYVCNIESAAVVIKEKDFGSRG